MVTYFRAAWWALCFGLFFHISMDEHHSILGSLALGAWWTVVVDRMTTGAIHLGDLRDHDRGGD